MQRHRWQLWFHVNPGASAIINNNLITQNAGGDGLVIDE
jgi:hypothetical protein